MSADTPIEWAHHTFNAWWGCVEAGPECDNCYARTFAHRLGKELWGREAPRPPASEGYWRQPERWNAAAERAGERHRVFAHSMSDVMEDRRDLDAPRARLFDLIERTPWLDWLLLTKRPAGFLSLTPRHWDGRWPRNAWAGTTCGTQAGLARVRELSRSAAPARVRFVSVEPLLEKVDLSRSLACGGCYQLACECSAGPYRRDVNWVIVGAESGAHSRPMEEAWARSIKDQCAVASVPFFLKQYADARGHKVSTPELDGRRWVEFPA